MAYKLYFKKAVLKMSISLPLQFQNTFKIVIEMFERKIAENVYHRYI